MHLGTIDLCMDWKPSSPSTLMFYCLLLVVFCLPCEQIWPIFANLVKFHKSMQFFDGFFGIWQNGKPTFELEMSQGFFLGGGVTVYASFPPSPPSGVWTSALKTFCSLKPKSKAYLSLLPTVSSTLKNFDFGFLNWKLNTIFEYKIHNFMRLTISATSGQSYK